MSKTLDLLARLRAAGLSQAEIHRRTGIPQPRLSKWGTGAIPVGADDALKLQALALQLEGEQVQRDAPEAAHAG